MAAWADMVLDEMAEGQLPSIACGSIWRGCCAGILHARDATLAAL
ncbi:hypothetical protein CP97_14792 [Aurantiacibacter atlanticus]|uniref:Uncharacterized protein n=1 Tax=Aurantiacibacter atlanticus TaxID=1648404 RepID=A0A168M2J9_9SPHN|nr:hypothetical protein CP97_14792 [Aurantiacibacter atlanticus]